MIHSIFIVNESGETVASVNLGKFKPDEVLFGGFLSAIQMYCQRMSGKQVTEVSLEDYRFIISRANGMSIVTIHDASDKKAESLNKELTKIVKREVKDIVTNETIEALTKKAK